MPSHQLPARSQILHRVSTLVEAMPQNWEQANPGDIWLLLEGDKFRQCKQLKIGTAHLEREDHLHDNCRLRWLRGLKAKTTSSNPPSPIQDATPSGTGSYQQVNAPSSGSDIFTAYQSELAEYKTSLEKATEEESVLQARLSETTAYAYQQFNFLESTTHQEMMSMTNNSRC